MGIKLIISVGEVVQDGVNGVVFDSSDDLYQALTVHSTVFSAC